MEGNATNNEGAQGQAADNNNQSDIDKATTPPPASDSDDAALFFGGDKAAQGGEEASDDNKDQGGEDDNAEQGDDAKAKDSAEQGDDKAKDKDAGEDGKDEQGKEEQGDDDKDADAYEAFNVPEGMQLDGELVEEFKPFAKELGLDQEQAQKGVDFVTKAVQKTMDNFVKAHDEKVQQWASDFKNDKEIGGNDADKNAGIARKAIETFGTPELKQILDETGLGNHPEMIRYSHRIGKAISEDSVVHVSGGDAPRREKSDAEFFAPSSVKKS